MLEKFYKELGLSEDAVRALGGAYDAIAERERTRGLFERARDGLLCDNEIIFNESVEDIVGLSGVHVYTLNLLLCVASLDELCERYREAGKGETFSELLAAIPPQIKKCKETEGVWGITYCFWQWIFHELVCERIGRLEYEPFFHFVDVPYKGIKKGDRVLLIHIPRSGSLDIDEVHESIKAAYERYKGDFDNKTLPFMTHSWLLYPPFLREVFKKGGNIQRFAELFDIISENTAGYQNFPNVFGCAYSEEALKSAPRETSLQRSMLEFINRGNQMGEGYGMFLYGENGRID